MEPMSGILVRLLDLVVIVLIIRALLSWFPISYESPFRPVRDTIYRVTDPILAPIRRVIPPMGGLDLSILVVILLIRVVLVPIVRTL
jgi:YggT family protein